MAPTMPSMVLSLGQVLEDHNLRYYLDVGLLDCPICMELFISPVYQCMNGHSICSSCCQKISRQECPSCSQPTGNIRSLMVEKILESLQVPCKHAPHGCKEMLQYSKKTERRNHEEKTCKHKPFPCPYPSCLHKGPTFAVPSHLAEAHRVQRLQLDPRRCAKFQMSNTDHFMMVELGHGGLMLVHRKQRKLRDVFFCTRSTASSQKYKLQVKCTAATSKYSLEASAVHVDVVVEKSREPSDKLLIHVASMDKPRKYDVEVEVRGS